MLALRSVGEVRATFGAASPPAAVHDAGAALEALWWQGKGGLWEWKGDIPCTEPCWEAAHRICQDPARGGALRAAEALDPDVTWVHALLHRIEGDAPNADGWYAAAGREQLGGTAEDEWAAIVTDVLDRLTAAAEASRLAREASAAERLRPRALSPAHTDIVNPLGSPARATVRVGGLRERFRLLHISDSHIDLGRDEGSGSAELCDFMADAYAGGAKALVTRGVATDALTAFETQVQSVAKENAVDLIVHTGDLLNFPSPAAARHAMSAIESTGLPSIFIAGNHDWQHYPDTLDGEPEALRLEWCERALAPLYSGQDPLHFYEDRAGLRLIAIDNSTNAVTQAQLDFFRESAAGADAVCLLVHIPLYSSGLLEHGRTDGNNPLGANSVMGTPAALGGNADETTFAFLREVERTPNLVAVLSGHIHDATSHPLDSGGGAVQLTTDAGCYDGCRVVTFEPADAASL